MKNGYHYIFLLLPALWVVGCNSNSQPAEEPESKIPDAPATEVQFSLVEKQPFLYQLDAGGKIEPTQQVILSFATGGVIEQVKYQNGNPVNAGSLIAALNQEKAELELEAARLALEQNKINFESEMLGYGSRLDSSNKDQIIRTQEINSGLASAQIKYKQALQAYRNTQLKAPFSGILANLNITPGNRVNPGQQVGLLYAPDKMQIRVRVLETEMQQLRKGATAEVLPLAYPNQPYSASLSQINPLVSEDGLIELTFDIQKPSGLLPGMNATVRLSIAADTSLLVPREAVVIRSGKEVVFLYHPEEQLAKWKYVTTGRENAEEVQILEGLEEGDTAIVTNNLQLAHDAPVTVVESGRK